MQKKGHMMSEAEHEKRMATMPGSTRSTSKTRKAKRQTSRSQAVRQGYRG